MMISQFSSTLPITLLLITIVALLALPLVAVSDHDQPPTHNITTSSPFLNQQSTFIKPHPPGRVGCHHKPWICHHGLLFPHKRQSCCQNRCVETSTDNNHCGGCGIKCPFNWKCCRGMCTNTNFNPFNCGRCLHRCPFGVLCLNGMCGYAGGGGHLPPFPFPFPFPPVRFPPRVSPPPSGVGQPAPAVTLYSPPPPPPAVTLYSPPPPPSYYSPPVMTEF